MQAQPTPAFARLQAEFCRALPEFTGVVPRPAEAGGLELALRLKDGGELVARADTLAAEVGGLATAALVKAVRAQIDKVGLMTAKMMEGQ